MLDDKLRGLWRERERQARRAGVPISTLRHREHDRGFPGVPAFLRLAEEFGVSPERLAEGVEDPADEDPEQPPSRRQS
jgi:transcriptional regulator with XRE-family HTH domain